MHERLNIARLQSVWIINCTSTILKEPIEDPRRIATFPWDLPLSKKLPGEQLKQSVVALSYTLKAKVGNRHPDDPPTVLATQKTR